MTKTTKTSHLKTKEIDQLTALKYIAENHLAKDGNLAKSINKLNVYVLHTINEGYFLKGNEKDIMGNIFEWTNKAKGGYGTNKANKWLAAFEGDTIVGVNMFRLRTDIELLWDGFLHSDSKEIAIALNLALFEHTKGKWTCNYSEYSEETETLLTMEDFEETLKYRKWADCMVPNHYLYYRVDKETDTAPNPEKFSKWELKRNENRRHMLKRLPDCFDEDPKKEEEKKETTISPEVEKAAAVSKKVGFLGN